ncbi:MAG: hypothetical protein WA966_01815 [Ornithinimicrobium sp.]
MSAAEDTDIPSQAPSADDDATSGVGSPGGTASDEKTSEGATVISYSHWQQVTVSVDDQHLKDIQTVATHLRDQGMHIDQILDGLGMITGSVPDQERSESVVHVTGVASVERQITYQLPPPDADVQ